MDEDIPSSAHVSATVPCSYDHNGTTINLYVTLDWTGVGDITKLKVKDFLTTPDFTVKMRAKGSFREATARGTVSDGVVDFTPPGSAVVTAGLEALKEGSVTIQRD